MKNIKYIYATLFTILFSVVSCDQFQNVSGVKELELLTATVNVTLDLKGLPQPDSLNIRLVNYSERYEQTVTVSPDEVITVDKVIPGIYTITVSAEKNKDGFNYNYNGNAVNIEITPDNKRVDINVGVSRSGALVFKEIFYCGSRTPAGKTYFRDQFYEIYNNSETVQNVRGLALGYLNPTKASATLPIWPGEEADQYVYAQHIWQVPDTEDFLLNPGESIIIAQMADNHQKENLNPNSPVNLLSAEFETLINTTALIQDNPAINMTMAFMPSSMPQWLTSVFGSAFVIYFPQNPIDPNSPTDVVSPMGATSKNYRIPIDEVVDAIECVDDETKIQFKRVPAILDAGAATVGGTYLSKSVARKVKETLPDGRVILVDTNNSTNDFEVMDVPQIRRYGAKAPAWNTWK